MALVNKCFCCGLPIATGFGGIYLLVGYLIGFSLELLWILESTSEILPLAVLLLCAGYFIMALFASLLIHGIATKNKICLVSWMCATCIWALPEGGLVIYMSVQYWRLDSIYGMTEVACWLIRIIVNVIELFLVQSLYTTWREEKLILRRLQELSMIPVPVPVSFDSAHLNNPIFYHHNAAFAHSLENLEIQNIKRANSTPQILNEIIPNNMTSLPYDSYQCYQSQSEFDASIFVPNNYLTNGNSDSSVKKSQSLMDLRLANGTPAPSIRLKSKLPPRLPQAYISQSVTPANRTNINKNYHLSLCKTISKPRPTLPKYASVDDLDMTEEGHHVIKNKSGFYAQPIENYGVPIYYGPLDKPDFLIYRKQDSSLNGNNGNNKSLSTAENFSSHEGMEKF